MDARVESRATNKLWPFLLQAAALGALVATVLSSASYIGLSAVAAYSTKIPDFETRPMLWDVAKATALFCAITVVSYGSFGLLAGFAIAAVLHLRRHRIRRFRRLLIESTAFGVLAALVFPLYDALAELGSLRGVTDRYAPIWLVPVAILCVASSIIGAVVFRKHFNQTTLRV